MNVIKRDHAVCKESRHRNANRISKAVRLFKRGIPLEIATLLIMGCSIILCIMFCVGIERNRELYAHAEDLLSKEIVYLPLPKYEEPIADDAIEESKVPERTKMRCTVYTGGGITKSGKKVREGYIASNNSNLGRVALLYTEDGEFIGAFECEDTGSAHWLKDGTAIDVYRESKSGCRDWISTYGDYVLVQWIDAEG